MFYLKNKKFCFIDQKINILFYDTLYINKNILFIRYTKIRNIVNFEFISSFTYITMNLDTFIFRSNANIISNCSV